MMRVFDFIKSRLLTGAILLSCLGLFFLAHTISTAHGTSVGNPAAEPGVPQISTAPHEAIVAEGRVVTYPGEQVSVSSEMAGRIVRLAVREGQTIHAGDVIAELDSAEYRAELAESTAKLAELDADIKLAEWKLPRMSDLTARGATPMVEVEQQRRDLAAARARREAAVAQIDRVHVLLARTSITSPIDGTVTARFAQPCEVIQPGTPIATIANLSRTRIEAEVNEFDGGSLAVGLHAFVTAEGFPGVRWPAIVEEVPQVIVTRQLRPQDPGRPTDSGVILTKLALQSPAPLRLGQRVEVTIEAGLGNDTESASAKPRR
jgi:RND family efflux transporter MFP subunit